MAMPGGSPVEQTGSLTGHILSQGRSEEPTNSRGNTAKVVVVLVIGLSILITVGLIVVLGAGDIFGSLFDGLISG